MLKIILILLIFLSKIITKRFIFAPTNRISEIDNWLKASYPCIGDHIRLDDSQEVTALFDHSLEVESISLPQNGIIVFSEYGIELGGNSNWQCKKKKTSEDVFFSPPKFPSFFDPSTWTSDTEPSYLHINKIPSKTDEVFIPELTSAQIFIDRPIEINSMNLYGRDKMTTNDINRLIQTVEGQFQFKISPRIGKESDIGGIQRELLKNVIKINNENEENFSKKTGLVNSNSENEVLGQICRYIKCSEPIECVDHFIPFGHCCSICGGKIDLVAHDLNMEESLSKAFSILLKLGFDENHLVTIERTNNDELTTSYQISIVPTSNTTFSEEIIETLTQKISENLEIEMKGQNGRSIISSKTFYSKIDRSLRKSSKFIGISVYFTVFLFIICFVTIWKYQNNTQKTQRLTSVITWSRGEAGNDDDVIINMLIDEKSDEEVEDNENKKTNIEIVDTNSFQIQSSSSFDNQNHQLRENKSEIETNENEEIPLIEI